MPTFLVEFTPGPPAVGVFTKHEVVAEDAAAAEQVVASRYSLVMFWRTTLLRDASRKGANDA